MSQLTPPEFNKNAFHCPHCRVFAAMQWAHMLVGNRSCLFVASKCASCQKLAIWRSKADEETVPSGLTDYSEATMVFPIQSDAAFAHPKMPDIIRPEFEEARLVAAISPRSAAALLRLCIEKLCRHLTGTNDGIDKQIAALVANGLSSKIQKALDTVRVIGNEAVHPGTLDVDDSHTFVIPLFRLINLIIEEQIAVPQEIDDLFEMLPEGKRNGIAARDARNKAGK